MTTKYITEVLKEINDNTSLLKTEYKKTNAVSLLGMLFEYAYLPQFKFLLPSGTPPYKEHTSPLGMTPAIFIKEINKFDTFIRKDLTNFKREMLFIQLLEHLHPQESKILLAIKEQELTKLYPNITYDVLADANYLPPKAKPVNSTPNKTRAKKTVIKEEPAQENITVEEI